MSNPITWRSIMGPSVADASRPMEAATRTFNAGFENLRDILKSSQTIEDANAKQMVTNQTNDALNQIIGLKTVDEFNAAKANGLYEKLTAPGAGIDQTTVRNAWDSRLSTLEQRAKQSWEFANAAQDQKEAPVRDEVAAAIARQDPLTTNIILNNTKLRNVAPLVQSLTNMQRQVVTEGQADTRHAWAGEEEKRKAADEVRRQEEAKRKADLFPLELEGKKLSNRATSEQIATSRNARETSDVTRLNANQQITQRMIDTLTGELDKINGGGKISTEAGYKAVTDFLKNVPDSESQKQLSTSLGKLITTGKYGDLNASQVIQALQADTDGGWTTFWNSSGDNLKAKLDEVLGNAEATKKALGNNDQLANLMAQRDTLKKRLFESLNPSTGGTDPKKPR